MLEGIPVGAAVGSSSSPMAPTPFRLKFQKVIGEIVKPFHLAFDSRLAGDGNKSVRTDKATGAEKRPLAVSAANRSLCCCYHTEHDPATARLKISFQQSLAKCFSGSYVPPKAHDGERNKGMRWPVFTTLFAVSSNSYLTSACMAKKESKRDRERKGLCV